MQRNNLILFKDVVVYDSQWKRLYLELMTNDDAGWRSLGEQLGKTSKELDYYERTEKNPAKALLNDWKDKHEAYLDVFKTAVKRIDNFSVLQLIEEFQAETKDDTQITPDKLRQLQRIPWKELEQRELIGSGGYAKVFKGIWYGVDVALKQLQMDTTAKHLVQDFIREATIFSRCHFPNIVRLYGVNTELEQYVMVLEYVSKGSLRSVLSDEAEQLPWPIRFQIANGIARGVNYLHSQQITHCDLKSPNVVLDELYTPKLTDFGMAKIKLETATKTLAPNTVMGSTRWMAPELVIPGTKQSHSTDIYSLGMVFWEVSSRKLPYHDAIDAVVVQWIKDGIQEKIPDVCPKDFASIIQSCWTDPPERPTADQVCGLLKKANFVPTQFPPKNDNNNNQDRENKPIIHWTEAFEKAAALVPLMDNERDWEDFAYRITLPFTVDWDADQDELFDEVVNLLLEYKVEPWPALEHLPFPWNEEYLGKFAVWISENRPHYMPDRDDGFIDFLRAEFHSPNQTWNEKKIAGFLAALETEKSAVECFIDDIIGNNQIPWTTDQIARLLNECEDQWCALTQPAPDIIDAILNHIDDYNQLLELVPSLHEYLGRNNNSNENYSE